MFRIPATLLLGAVLALPVQAQTPPPSAEEFVRLEQALGLPAMVQIMRTEGMAYGVSLAEEMFPDRAGGAWPGMVSEIYSIDAMNAVALPGFEAAVTPEDFGSILAFLESPLGVEIVALEVAARRALLDEAIEEANDAHVAELRDEATPRMDQIADFIDANDLLDTNVTGALSSNYAFFSGLMDGGAYEAQLSDAEILKEVMSQEDQIREDTDSWLYGFLSMAYTPLSDADMDKYIVFSKTRAGQTLNDALFVGFDEMFHDIAYKLGRAAADVMRGEDL